MYSYCCLCILIVSLCILIVSLCILIVVYVFLFLSMYSYCCLCILIVVYVFLLLSMYAYFQSMLYSDTSANDDNSFRNHIR